MFRVALCGGIGSGKSAVTAILRDLGAKVVVADEINAQLLTEPDYIKKIETIFPTVVHNHSINKKELAAIVYRDEKMRRALMALSHPLIFERMFAAYQDSKIVFYEIPLLSETAYTFDLVWYVDADIDLRVERVMLRDGVDATRAKKIISLQRAEDKLRERADFVIDNRHGVDDLRRVVSDQYCLILERFL